MHENRGREIRTFLVLQTTASEIDHLYSALRGVFEQDILCTVNGGS